MGESASSRAVSASRDQIVRDNQSLRGINPNVTNRFNNYNTPFSANNKFAVLDEINQKKGNILAREGNADVNRAGLNAISRARASGLTKGSLYNNSILDAKSRARNAKYDSLAKLKANMTSAKLGIMDQENSDRFNITNSAQNVDLQNISNLFRKYGLLQSGMNSEINAGANLDSDTPFDNVLAFTNTAANLIKAFQGGATPIEGEGS